MPDIHHPATAGEFIPAVADEAFDLIPDEWTLPLDLALAMISPLLPQGRAVVEAVINSWVADPKVPISTDTAIAALGAIRAQMDAADRGLDGAFDRFFDRHAQDPIPDPD